MLGVSFGAASAVGRRPAGTGALGAGAVKTVFGDVAGDGAARQVSHRKSCPHATPDVGRRDLDAADSVAPQGVATRVDVNADGGIITSR